MRLCSGFQRVEQNHDGDSSKFLLPLLNEIMDDLKNIIDVDESYELDESSDFDTESGCYMVVDAGHSMYSWSTSLKCCVHNPG